MWSYEYKQSFNVDPNNPNNESQKNLTNNKNSSGLTKGAIAGIALLAQQLQNKRHNLNFWLINIKNYYFILKTILSFFQIKYYYYEFKIIF